MSRPKRTRTTPRRLARWTGALAASLLALGAFHFSSERDLASAEAPPLIGIAPQPPSSQAISPVAARVKPGRSPVRAALTPETHRGDSSARSWRVVWAGDGTPFESGGTIAVETRSGSEGWRTCGPAVIRSGGLVDISSGVSGDFEFRVDRGASEVAGYLVDDRGLVKAGDGEVVLRVSREALISARDGATGVSIPSVWIAEAAGALGGVNRAVPTPGPEGFESRLRRLRAPFSAEILRGYRAPIVGAPGLAWAAVPAAVQRSGGVVALGPGYRIDVEIAPPIETQASSLAKLQVVLFGSEAPGYGSGIAGFDFGSALRRAGGAQEVLSGSGARVLRWSGLPHEVKSAGSLALFVRPGGGEEPARALGGVEEAGLIRLGLESDARQGPVEGYVLFEDEALASKVEGIKLYSVGPAPHPEAITGRRLRLGDQLRVHAPGVLRFDATGLRPGRYSVLLQPLGIYGSITVESLGGGPQTLSVEIPELVPMTVHLVDGEGASVMESPDVAVAAYVGEAASARPLTMRLWNATASGSAAVEIRAPRGAVCRVLGSAGSASADAEWVAIDGEYHELRVRPAERWLRLERSALRGPDGEALLASDAWWRGRVFLEGPKGERLPLRRRQERLTSAPRGDTFGPWGLAEARGAAAAIEVAVPAGAVTLLRPSVFQGAADERIAVGPRERLVRL